MFSANPRFARGESGISLDMLKSLRRVYGFSISKATHSKTLKPATLKPKLTPKVSDNLELKSLRVASVFMHPLVISICGV